MKIKEGDILKVNKDINYYYEHCPICNSEVVSQCKCRIGNRMCSKHHNWYIKDNNVIYGTGHGGSKSEPIEINESIIKVNLNKLKELLENEYEFIDVKFSGKDCLIVTFGDNSVKVFNNGKTIGLEKFPHATIKLFIKRVLYPNKLYPTSPVLEQSRTNKKRERGDGKSTDLKMNPETYALRRKVIDYIYRAKKIYETLTGQRNWKRVNVRIVKLSPEDVLKGVLGYASLEGFDIRIPATTLKKYKEQVLHEIVFHELLHAMYGIGHDTNNRLMTGIIDSHLTHEQIDKLFSDYVKKLNNIKEMKITKNYLKSLIYEIFNEQVEKRKYVKVSPEMKSKMNLYRSTKQKDFTPIINDLKSTPEFNAIIKKDYKLVSSDKQEKNGIIIFRNDKTKQSFKIDSFGRVAKFTKDIEGTYIIKPSVLKPLETVEDYVKILKSLTNKI